MHQAHQTVLCCTDGQIRPIPDEPKKLKKTSYAQFSAVGLETTNPSSAAGTLLMLYLLANNVAARDKQCVELDILFL